MALAILDGTQTATTLSSVVTGGEHIVAHSVVSLGSNAISNIATAVSGSTVCVGNLGLLQSAVATEGLPAFGSFIKIGGHTGTSTTGNIVHVSAAGALRVDGSAFTQPVSIASVTIGNTVTIAGTVTANPTGTQTIAGTVTIASLPAISGAVTVVSLGTQAISDVRNAVTGAMASGSISLRAGISQIGSVTCSAFDAQFTDISAGGIVRTALHYQDTEWYPVSIDNGLPVSIGGAIPAGTNRIGVVTIGAGTVTIGAGTAQIGSVTASISGTVPVSISSVTVGNSVTIGSLPAISGTVTANVFGKDANSSATPQIPVISYDEGIAAANFGYVVPVQVTNVGGEISEANPLPIYGTVTVGNSVTISSLPAISGTVTANTFALQGTAVTTSNFTSTTPSTVLASANSGREVLTIFNEGAGNLHICAGATCTTIAYQVRLSAGDYYEVPNHQTTITHSAVFATAGTARVCQVS